MKHILSCLTAPSYFLGSICWAFLDSDEHPHSSDQ